MFFVHNVFLCISLLFISARCKLKYEIDLERTEVYGPGLQPHKLVLPVRYFIINVFNVKGKRVNKSLGDVFKVQIEGESSSGTYCRVWSQVLDRYDGSYIVRYRTYQTCRDTSIHVLYRNQHVAKSPYRIKEPIYPEDCLCPDPEIDTWMKIANCPSSYSQISNDLEPFKDVDFNSVLKEATVRFNQTGSKSFCNYVIKNNRVYRNCYGQHVGFNMFMDNILHSIIRKVRIPDLEFIVNLGDWPLVRPSEKPLIPIFSWCGSDDTADIVIPTYEITEATLEMMGRVMLDIFSVQSNNKIPWTKKIEKVFWRGRDSRQERLDLIDIAREHPELINASMTNFFFFRDQEEKYGPKEKHVSFFNFFDYKYQLNIDGTVAAYRLPYLLAGDGAVLKQESSYYEYFYKSLEPYIHYLPVKRDLSDLIEKIEWAKNNDEAMKEMNKSARLFALDNLLPTDIYCYHLVLFKEWSKRLRSAINVRPGMEHIATPQNEKRFGDCKCHKLNKHDEL